MLMILAVSIPAYARKYASESQYNATTAMLQESLHDAYTAGFGAIIDKDRKEFKRLQCEMLEYGLQIIEDAEDNRNYTNSYSNEIKVQKFLKDTGTDRVEC